MKAENKMVTEVQIKKSGSHLSHLRRIVACIASRLGMSKNEVENTENAVSELCLRSLETNGDCPEENLNVKVTTSGMYMMVEITDPCPSLQKIGDNENFIHNSQIPECIRTLVDDIELLENEGSTVRIVKYASQRKPEAVGKITMTATTKSV